MKLGRAIDILYANVINEPSISSFSGATSNISNVKRGDLFFAHDKSHIDEAIKLGAYGIVFEGFIEKITDKEIAWLLVENINQSIKRFVRYLILESKYKILLVDNIELEMAKSICNEKNIKEVGICYESNLLSSVESFYKYYIKSMQDENPYNFIISNITQLAYMDIPKLFSLNFSKKIQFEKMEELPKELIANKSYKKFSVLSYSLFECKVEIFNICYKLPISYVFLPFLESLIALLEYCESIFQTNTINKERTLFSNESISKKKYYSLKDFNHFSLVEIFYIDLQNRISNTKNKMLVFCRNLGELSYIIESDFNYAFEIENNMKELLQKLRMNKKETLLDLYLDINAPHLSIVSCFNNRKLVGSSTKKHIKILYAHNKHLYEIVTKQRSNIFVIYGANRHNFIRMIQDRAKEKAQTKRNFLL